MTTTPMLGKTMTFITVATEIVIDGESIMVDRNHLTPPSSLTRSLTERHVLHPNYNHLEDRIAIQNRDIQTLLHDNQSLAAAHVPLRQELALAEQELRLISTAATNVKSERDAEVREAYERSVKLDAEARAVVAMSSELAHVRADMKKFSMDNKELMAELEALNDEIAKTRMEAKQVPTVKADVEALRKEINKERKKIH